ncbi:hypothetical protein ACYCCF_31350 [Streptomyces argenteolus]|uniref:hypothetical protein n=1 Tax=Streptomyces sp. NPDC025273 TaxID=3155251 RepID=UPI00340E0E7A
MRGPGRPPRPGAVAVQLRPVARNEGAELNQRIGAPHLSFRRTDKEPPSKQKQARTCSPTGALSDMRKHGLSEIASSTKADDSLRNLTTRAFRPPPTRCGAR